MTPCDQQTGCGDSDQVRDQIPAGIDVASDVRFQQRRRGAPFMARVLTGAVVYVRRPTRRCPCQLKCDDALDDALIVRTCSKERTPWQMREQSHSQLEKHRHHVSHQLPKAQRMLPGASTTAHTLDKTPRKRSGIQSFRSGLQNTVHRSVDSDIAWHIQSRRE